MPSDAYWVANGRITTWTPRRDAGADEDRCLHRLGFARLVAGANGTEIRWSVFSPCFASMFHIADRLCDLPGPYMLRYFLAGWFEEMQPTAAARRRILDIVARGDIHLSQRVYVREMDPCGQALPASLHDTWIDGNALPEHSVDCVYEESSGRFRVARIGARSTIARLWGTTPQSYPCFCGSPYDFGVSAAYGRVLRSGRPRYDHVYAAMRTPDGAVVWIPYQRVIVPKHLNGRRGAVSVVTEIAKVAISIV
jgi:hypothetical protein